MKELLKKGALLFVAAMAMCAFAMPSMASALTWGPLAATHTIDSSNLSMVIPAMNSGWTCSTTQLDADVKSPPSSQLTITGARFGGCSGSGGMTGCPVDITAAGLDWNATGVTTSNVTIGTMNWNLAFTSGCPFAGTTMSVEGTLTNGVWNPLAHAVSYSSAPGLNGYISGSPVGPVAVTGTLTDTSGTLTLS